MLPLEKVHFRPKVRLKVYKTRSRYLDLISISLRVYYEVAAFRDVLPSQLRRAYLLGGVVARFPACDAGNRT